MQDEIDAVLIAMNQFATYYQDEEVIQWGLVMGPFAEPKPDTWGNNQVSEIIANLSPFSNFIGGLSGVNADSYDENGKLIPQIYKEKTRKGRK